MNLFPCLISGNKDQWHFTDPHYQEILFDQCSEQLTINQEILFDQGSEQLRSFYEFISVAFSYFSVVSLYC